MARTLNIRIQVIIANPEQDDKFYGIESTQTVIQLIHDDTDSGHYDYTLHKGLQSRFLSRDKKIHY